MSLLNEIIKMREELQYLEKQYINETPPCCNTNCSFWRGNHSGNCSWSVLLEDCKDYKSEINNC